MSLVSCLFIDCHDKNCERIIKEILTKENAPQCSPLILNHVKLFPCTLDTKYYQAPVNLCLLKSLIHLEQFVDIINKNNKDYDNNNLASTTNTTTINNAEGYYGYEGLVIHFECRKISSEVLIDEINHEKRVKNFEKLKIIFEKLKLSFAFKIIVCSNADSIRSQIIDWCIDNEVELVEMDKEEEEEEEEEKYNDIIEEKKKVDRIIEIIKCHQWSNLILKNPKLKSKVASDIINGTKSLINNNNNNNINNDSNNNNIDNNNSKEEFGDFQAYNEEKEEDFEVLFKKLANFKSKADEMTGEERRKYAEEIATKFWISIGGEDEKEEEGEGKK